MPKKPTKPKQTDCALPTPPVEPSENAKRVRRSQLEPVDVPEWKLGDVYVTPVSAATRMAIQKETAGLSEDEAGQRSGSCLWCIYSACDQDGELLFVPADIDELQYAPIEPIDRCALAAMKLNGIDVEPAGNAEATPSES